MFACSTDQLNVCLAWLSRDSALFRVMIGVLAALPRRPGGERALHSAGPPALIAPAPQDRASAMVEHAFELAI